MDFACYDGVEPAFDDFPNSWFLLVVVFAKGGGGWFTLEYPGSFVNKDYTEGFGVVCFEAFYHEFHGCVILGLLALSSDEKM